MYEPAGTFVSRYMPSASVVARKPCSQGFMPSERRKPIHTPAAGLSLIVTRPDTEPRGVLAAGCFAGACANNDAARQTIVIRAGTAQRAEDLITVAPLWVCVAGIIAQPCSR